MERLTIEYLDQYVPKALCTIDRLGGADDCIDCAENCEECKQNCEGCPIQECFNRLAAYEDTGLTPEKLKEIDRLYTEQCKELAKLKENKGRWIPCSEKLQDTKPDWCPLKPMGNSLCQKCIEDIEKSTIKAFIINNEAWWHKGEDCENPEIYIGVYYEDGSLDGEFKIVWDNIGIQLKAYQDSWETLSKMPELLDLMKRIDVEETQPTIKEFAELLKGIGFKDITKRKDDKE